MPMTTLATQILSPIIASVSRSRARIVATDSITSVIPCRVAT
jgi:hypothetical protein